MKTTSPEKFRVRPSAGCLPPGGKATITVTLLPGFQLGGLSRDKFLVMSMPVDSIDLLPQDLTELWKVRKLIIVTNLILFYFSPAFLRIPHRRMYLNIVCDVPK